MIENLTFEQIEENKNQIIELLLSTKREGIEGLVEYLKGSTFFTDPASISGYGNKTYHGSFRGGLALHSLCVYKTLKQYKDVGLFDFDDGSIIICALMHDLCKVGTYEIEIKNVKNAEGQWTTEQRFISKADEGFTYGHGEKSVDMLRDFIKLSDLEKMAIRFHMGAYEGENAWIYVEPAFKKHPFIFYIHVADEYSSKYLA